MGEYYLNEMSIAELLIMLDTTGLTLIINDGRIVGSEA